MITRRIFATAAAITLSLIVVRNFQLRAQAPASDPKVITEADCTVEKLGSTIPANSIAEPVAAVTLSAPRWVPSGNVPAYCSIDGAIAPVDKSANGRPINFRVILPASWSHRAAQSGGGGFNGSIPLLTGGEMASVLRQGFATYGSDSGHQQGRDTEWTLSDEAIKNLGYMQMKKTHDAALVLIQRAYADLPQYNYFIGTSQGGREL